MFRLTSPTHIQNFLLLGACVFILQGCATINEVDCLSADWTQVGFIDGERGLKSNQINSHKSACKKFDVQPDHEHYAMGHKSGAIEFCQPIRGYETGRNRSEYNYICPPDLEPAFIRGYINGLKAALESVRAELEDIGKKVTSQRGSYRSSRYDSLTFERRRIRNWLGRAIARLQKPTERNKK